MCAMGVMGNGKVQAARSTKVGDEARSAFVNEQSAELQSQYVRVLAPRYVSNHKRYCDRLRRDKGSRIHC